VGSLFTGRYPSRHGAVRGFEGEEGTGFRTDLLDDSLRTLPEILQEAGYGTAGILFQYHLAPELGFAQGFDTYTEKAGEAPAIHDRLLGWIRDLPEDRPFLAVLHYIDVHEPYTPAPPFDRVFGPVTNRIGYPEGWRDLREAVCERGEALDGETLAMLRTLYDGEIRQLDEEIGKLIHGLREMDLYEDLLIVVTADHGDEFMEHGKIGHSYGSLHGEILHVPLILKAPGLAHRGRTVDARVELVDVMPTMLEMASLPVPGGLDGASLVPLLRGDPAGVKPHAYAESASAAALYRDGYKLILHLEDDRAELFDIVQDPLELTDLAGQDPARVQALREEIDMIRGRAPEKQGPATPVDLSPDLRRNLQGLGYLR
jgi:arylsulfatase A-like enzyme